MKSMTCLQLGGACDQVFTGETFDELASLSKQHGGEMFAIQDAPHMAAMEQMMELMKNGQMETWMSARRAEFEAI
ncbi:MAG: hypothetical protein RLZ41_660 [Actinomycetota bacterium]|jgi:hypothetical protein